MRCSRNAIFLGLWISALSAVAAPFVSRIDAVAGALIVYVTNAADQSYDDCTLKYTWSGEIAGVRDSYTVDQIASIPAKVKDFEAIRTTGGLDDMKFETYPTISCSDW
jgi:hypothetical protein